MAEREFGIGDNERTIEPGRRMSIDEDEQHSASGCGQEPSPDCNYSLTPSPFLSTNF